MLSAQRRAEVIMHAELTRAVERVLATGDAGITLSSRAGARLNSMRDEMPYVDGESLLLVITGDEIRIWTFAGGRANAMMADALRSAGASLRTIDNLGVTLRGLNQAAIDATLDRIIHGDCRVPIDRHTLAELKFAICLPEPLAEDVLQARLSDTLSLHQCLQRPRRWMRIAA